MRLFGLLLAVNAVVVHWLNRACYCPRGHHRDAVVHQLGHLVYRCVDCGRQEELGPVFHHGSNHKTRRSA